MAEAGGDLRGALSDTVLSLERLDTDLFRCAGPGRTPPAAPPGPAAPR